MLILYLCLLLLPAPEPTPGASTPAPPRQSCKAERVRAEKMWRERELVAFPSNPMLALRCRNQKLTP
jgi:hypothetical protein